MPRGRPLKSEIRQRIIEIIAALQEPTYGYAIYRIYREVYPKATLRVMYYHLKKATQTGELKIERVEHTEGDYSWGSTAEKVYYTLGPQANIKGDSRILEYLKKREV